MSRRGVPPFPCFLLSLCLPGLGQIVAGAPARGVVMAAAATAAVAALATGAVVPPWAAGADARGVALLAGLGLLWIMAAYDAWFRVREKRNDMLACLPRTPRVAFLADAACGGLGRIYLDGLRELPWVGPAAIALFALAWTAHPAILAVLAVWNVALGAWSWSRAVRRYHGTPAYAHRQAELDAAPFASPQAPSPSLPFATLVAVFIAAMGALFVARTLRNPGIAPAPGAAGRMDADRFVASDGTVEMLLPADWSARAGRFPVLLEARRETPSLTFTLARARVPLFREDDVVPYGALSRFADGQESDLAATLPGFRPLSRTPLQSEPPGIRLVFASRPGGRDTLNVQEYLLDHDRILVLTLSGAAGVGAQALGDEMDLLGSGLRLEGAIR